MKTMKTKTLAAALCAAALAAILGACGKGSGGEDGIPAANSVTAQRVKDMEGVWKREGTNNMLTIKAGKDTYGTAYAGHPLYSIRDHLSERAVFSGTIDAECFERFKNKIKSDLEIEIDADDPAEIDKDFMGIVGIDVYHKEDYYLYSFHEDFGRNGDDLGKWFDDRNIQYIKYKYVGPLDDGSGGSGGTLSGTYSYAVNAAGDSSAEFDDDGKVTVSYIQSNITKSNTYSYKLSGSTLTVTKDVSTGNISGSVSYQFTVGSSGSSVTLTENTYGGCGAVFGLPQGTSSVTLSK